MAQEQTQFYKCPDCGIITNGKWGDYALCLECYEVKAMAGEIDLTKVMPWPINWNRVIKK